MADRLPIYGEIERDIIARLKTDQQAADFVRAEQFAVHAGSPATINHGLRQRAGGHFFFCTIATSRHSGSRNKLVQDIHGLTMTTLQVLHHAVGVFSKSKGLHLANISFGRKPVALLYVASAKKQEACPFAGRVRQEGKQIKHVEYRNGAVCPAGLAEQIQFAAFN